MPSFFCATPCFFQVAIFCKNELYLIFLRTTTKKLSIMRLRPRYNNVIIKPLGEKSQTDSGLILPAIAMDNLPIKKGEVIEAGAGKPGYHISDLKPGSKVLYVNGSGIEIEFNKEKVIIMKDVDLPIIIED